MGDKYGVILDAGSSGTRIHIYKWQDHATARKTASPAQLRGLPEVKTKKKWTKKIKPGVSTFHDKPAEVGREHLAPLFEHALDVIPKNSIPDTPIFLLATAGMRLLPDRERKRLLDEICTYARRNTQFLLPDCDLHIQVISGETEGLYGWISANYLLGGFDDPVGNDHGKGHHTYGFLDMGGASAQIAFAPNATEAEKHAEDLKLLKTRNLNGEGMDYKVFVTTWLGFGVNEARKRYVEKLVEASAGEGVKELPDPCLPRGLRETLDGKEIEESDVDSAKDLNLIGTGLFAECQRQTYPLLDKDAPCVDVPCLLNGVHVPAIDFDVNHFVGVSEYWHTTHEIFEKDAPNKAYDLATYQTRIEEFCSQDWKSIETLVSKHHWGKKIDEEKAMELCFKASWLINVLHEGIGIPRLGIKISGGSKKHNATEDLISAAKDKGFLEPFQAVEKIHDVEVSWTLGKMVLYASSQIPPSAPSSPSSSPQPVGFGTNILDPNGLPKDFQYAGSTTPLGKSPQHPSVPSGNGSSNNYSTDSNTQWHDTLWKEGDTAPRRIPGILLFIAIFLIALFLLLGREKRRKFFSLFKHSSSSSSSNPRSRKRKSTLPSFNPSSSSSANIPYDRLPDEEETIGEFELGPYVDEETNNSSDTSSSSPPHNGYGYYSGAWRSKGAKVSAVRTPAFGMVEGLSRNVSRERLSVSSRSRDGSPGGGAVGKSALPPRRGS